MNPTVSPKIEFNWAEERWTDPLTGTEVVRLSPPGPRHCRNNYFRMNLMTWDGRYIVFLAATEIQVGTLAGQVRLVARDMANGAVRELGELTPVPIPKKAGLGQQGADVGMFAVARHSHKVNAIDYADPDAPGLIQFDIDTGASRRIRPSERLCNLYEPSFDASEQYVYTPWWKEGWPLRATMEPDDHRAMMAARPGYQEMVRIHLATGQVEPIFSATDWWMGHPNPHPRDPDLFLCCQEWWGEDPKSRWGCAKEHERIRILGLRTREWDRRARWGGFHEFWANQGRRVYAHGGWLTHCIYRNDIETGQVQSFHCQAHEGVSVHVMAAPNEAFLVGDGSTEAAGSWGVRRDELLAKAEREPAIRDQEWFRRAFGLSPGEVIWKYELPAKPLWDTERYGQGDGWIDFMRDLAAHPDQGIRCVPVCQFRSMTRTLFKGGHRLESNAHVTPDSRWVVFQSSSDDDWFEVWAARVPGVK